MNTLTRSYSLDAIVRRPRVWLLLMSSVAAAVVFQPQMGNAQSLGSAATFAGLANSTITFAGSGNVVEGNLGLTPGTSVTGVYLQTNGMTYTGTEAQAVTAMSDANSAYSYILAETPTTNMSGAELGGLTLTNGIFSFQNVGTAADLTGILTLNGPGTYVFQMGSTFTSAANSSIVLENGAQASNVFWQVGSSATFGANSMMKGNFLAGASITVGSGANNSGSLIALTGAVTLNGSNNITAVPEPTTYALLSLGALVLLFVYRRKIQAPFRD